MKIQRLPIILLVIAAVLGSFVYLYEIQGASKRQEEQAKSQQLYSFQESDVQAFTLKTPNQTLSFEKVVTLTPSPAPSGSPSPSASPSESNSWRMTAPQQKPASDASVAYLLNLVATTKSENTLTVPANKQAEFGLDQPTAIVDITLKDKKTHRLVLGKPDFNRSFMYAQVDPPSPPANDITVKLVSMDFENAVNRPLAEWEAKPTPSPNPEKPKEKPSK